MKSNVCKIEKGAKNLDRIFTESEKVAVYNELNPKQTLKLRLLCEELVGMMPYILSDFSGDFWIENQGSDYELCLSVSTQNMDAATKERLIGVSKEQKNATAVGITGKIRAAFDCLVMGSKDMVIPPDGMYGFSSSVNFYHLWSLKHYYESVHDESNPKPEVWDEFEKSIIAKVADDVIVGIKGTNVTIIIKKNFA